MRKGTRWTEQLVRELHAKGKIQGWKYIDGKPDPGEPPKKKGPNKYNATKVEYDGYVFDSIKEYKRYRQLLLLLKAGAIGYLNVHPVYRLEVNGELVATYEADFNYIDAVTGLLVVEDVKSKPTAKLPSYRKNKKLMKALYGIEIVEIMKVR